MIVEFGVELPPEFKDGKWHVAGRCYTDIPAGCLFTLVVQKEFYKKDKNDSFLTTLEIGQAPVHLVLDEAHAYRRRFKWLSKGLTALLILSGDGANLTGNCTLRGEGEMPENLEDVLYNPSGPSA
jgi:hypothetical protein